MTTLRSTALFSVLLACPVLAQEPPPAPQEAGEREQAAPEDLIRRLGDPSYQVRQQAEADLLRRGEAVLEDLRQAAEGHQDAEVRWRARRLVRQLERGDQGGLRRRQEAPPRPRSPGLPPAPGRLDDVFDSIFRQLEQDFGMDVPRARFFSDSFFQDLRQQMQDMRMQGMPQLDEGQSFRMQMGTDGVKVTVTEVENGETRTETYEAPDLETFREKYPEVARRYLGNGGLRLQVPRVGQNFGPQGGQPRGGLVPRGGRTDPFVFPVTPPGTEPRVPEGPTLGVFLPRAPMSADLRAFLGLEEGQGLLVADVAEGSLAEELGIEPNDVLLTIDGKAVGSAADVRRALQEAADRVTVTVNRRGEELDLEADYEPPEHGLRERKQ